MWRNGVHSAFRHPYPSSTLESETGLIHVSYPPNLFFVFVSLYFLKNNIIIWIKKRFLLSYAHKHMLTTRLYLVHKNLLLNEKAVISVWLLSHIRRRLPKSYHVLPNKNFFWENSGVQLYIYAYWWQKNSDFAHRNEFIDINLEKMKKENIYIRLVMIPFLSRSKHTRCTWKFAWRRFN